MKTAQDEVRSLLGIGDEEYLTASCQARLPKLFARMLQLTDEQIVQILVLITAETLPVGSVQVEILGHLLKVDMQAWWSPDEAFFGLLRDKPAINAMLAEIGGRQAAQLRVAETARVQKEAIQHCLAGTGGHSKADAWLPRYFRFPMQSYTKRKGLRAVNEWNAVKKYFN